MSKQYAMVVEVDRCIGCYGGCQVACKLENGTGPGDARCRLYTIGPTGTFPDLSMYFLPVMCQQCEDPRCVQVCPVGACFKSSEDGVVRIDRDKCIGCRACVRACPFRANLFDAEQRKADKCDLCARRREAGESPVCVRNCAGGALHFGDIHDPDSEVSRLLAENEGHVFTLPDDSGCRPSGRFILKNAEWIDMLPFSFEAERKEVRQNG